jgi:hypothetical protein
MKSYTLHDLSMNVSGEKFVLPFDGDVTDEEIIDKVVSLFSKVKFYERELFTDRGKSGVSVDEYGNVLIQCLYEGSDDYYKFSLRFEVFRLKYDSDRRIYYKTFREIEDRQWMAAMIIETEHGALLEELVELKSLPKFIDNAELENYIMKFF